MAEKRTGIFSELSSFFRGAFLSALRGNDSRAAARLRRWAYRTPCYIDTEVFITDRRNFSAAEGTALYHGCYILNRRGFFSMGRRSHLGAYCYVNVNHGRLTIGDDVAIGPGCRLIVYSNHYEAGRKVTDLRITRDIIIGSNVFIGADCVILPGSVIGDNTVFAAGAVVKGELEPNAVYGGAPCRLIEKGWYDGAPAPAGRG
jgi:acetyltransferase-like isoleucine patch superfamily enzyme